MQDLASLRKSYERAELDEAHSEALPLAQFERWLQQALDGQIPEPTAMTLATVSAAGQPSTRVVLLKGCDARGLVWYTNYQSRKGQELAANPRAALQFHWVELERQVRIEGRVQKAEPELADAYFASRPLLSRVAAWASAQSQTVASRAALEAELERYGQRFGEQVPRPPHWGGYRLVPERWEFWQGRRSRLHDRLVYAQNDEGWQRERLAP
jgi:pyridoxamine 5'-phosphate oxidase